MPDGSRDAAPGAAVAPRETGTPGACVTLAFLPTDAELAHVPAFRTAAGRWQAHAPAIGWLLRMMAPRRIVDLGAAPGESTFALADALAMAGRKARLLAIDSFAGDRQSGGYGPEVIARFRAECAARTGPRPRLVTGDLAEALGRLPDRSIDLAHLDAAPDPLSVAAAWSALQPKLAADAVLLLHGIAGGTASGARGLWDALCRRPGASGVALLGGDGLGVLSLGPGHADPFRRFAALPEAISAPVLSALAAAGARVLALAQMEAGLHAADGRPLRPTAPLAAGAARDGFIRLADMARAVPAGHPAGFDARLARLEARHLALRSELQALSDRVEEEIAALEDRLEATLGLALDRLADGLMAEADAAAERLQASLTARIAAEGDRILAGAGSVQAAIDAALRAERARLARALSPSLRRRARMIAALVAPEADAARRPKEDAQDDAIHGIAAKAEAQDAAILSLAETLKRLEAHPLLRPAGRR